MKPWRGRHFKAQLYIHVMVGDARERVKLFCSNHKPSLYRSVFSKRSITHVFRTSGDEDSSGCNFHVKNEPLRDKNELNRVSFVFLMCIDPLTFVKQHC